MNNVVRPDPGPTLETADLSETSTHAARSEPGEDDTATAYPTRRRSSHDPAPLQVWLAEHGIETLLVVVIVGAIAFLFQQVYGLNREVGEARFELRQIKSDLATVETRATRETERIERRIDATDAQHKPAAKK